MPQDWAIACAECTKVTMSQYENVRGDDEVRHFLVGHRGGALELCMV